MRQHTVFISPQQLLAEQQSNQAICVIDLSPEKVYLSGHIPGAVHLDEKRVVATDKPVGGLLPDDPDLSRLFSELGITPNTRVIAYDEQGNSRAYVHAHPLITYLEIAKLTYGLWYPTYIQTF